jgi:hypothetical protein
MKAKRLVGILLMLSLGIGIVVLKGGLFGGSVGKTRVTGGIQEIVNVENAKKEIRGDENQEIVNMENAKIENWQRMTAEEFFQEFWKDNAAANAKYQNKVLEITGKVDWVSQFYYDWNPSERRILESGSFTIQMRPQVESIPGSTLLTFLNFYIKVPRKPENFPPVKISETVTIRGVCIGQINPYTVAFENCILVNNSIS